MITITKSTLMEDLQARARAAGIVSDRELARQLGVSPATLTNIKKGRRQMGRLFLNRVIVLFPDLRNEVMRYVELTDPAA